VKQSPNRAATSARISGIVGALVWLVFFFIRTTDSLETELIQKILLLGILVIVPLALSLVPDSDSQNDSLLYTAAVSAQPVAAMASALSFLFKPAAPAGVLAASWLLVTAVVGVFGISRLLKSGQIFSRDLGMNVGMIYLPVGAVWLITSRFGIQPIGFGDTIVLLTAVHFHFAGFAAPFLASLAARQIRILSPVFNAYSVAVVCLISGTPLVAAGITFSAVLALVGAIIISVGLVVLAIVVLGWVMRSLDSFVAQTLLVVSSLSSIAAMVLACLYAYSIVAKTVIVDIPQMALTHGILNSFGFALCGLSAWAIESVRRHRIETLP